MKIKPRSLPVLTCATVVLLSAGCSYFSKRADTTTVSSPTANSAPNQNQQTTPASPLPSPTGFVNDYAGVFEPAAKLQLESVLTELRDKSAIEFAVVTVDTTGGQPIFDYSLAVARGWGVGPKDASKGGGLLLMMAMKDRQWRLQVSDNLKKDLPDEVCKDLGEQSRDLYEQGKYDEGIRKYVKAVINRLEGIRGFKLSSEL